MKKKQRENLSKIIIILTVISIISIVFFASKQNQICFEEHCFDVEIADTIEEREKGLMFIKSLDEDTGMLFIFEEEGIYPFWMRNTLISLDIIWINSGKEVVYISKNTPSCGYEQLECPIYEPDKSALYVLEINAGAADKMGLEIGDKLDLFTF